MIEISNGYLLFRANEKTQPKLLRMADFIFFDVRPAPMAPGSVGKFQLIAVYETSPDVDCGTLLYEDLEEECVSLQLGIWDAIKKDAPVLSKQDKYKPINTLKEEVIILDKDGNSHLWRTTGKFDKCHRAFWEEVKDA